MGWKPIKTAPRDGSWVLLVGGNCDGDAGDNDRRPVVAQWTNYRNGRTGRALGRWQFAWYESGYFGTYDGPTHWMPLPAPPVSASRAANRRPTA